MPASNRSRIVAVKVAACLSSMPRIFQISEEEKVEIDWRPGSSEKQAYTEKAPDKRKNLVWLYLCILGA